MKSEKRADEDRTHHERLHDLRTLLTAIITYTDLLLKMRKTKKRERIYQRSERKSLRLKVLD